MCWTKALWPRFVNGADLKYNYCYEGRNNRVRSRIKKAILRKNFKYRQTKKNRNYSTRNIMCTEWKLKFLKMGRGLRRCGDVSILLFNLTLEKVVRQLYIIPKGAIFNRRYVLTMQMM